MAVAIPDIRNLHPGDHVLSAEHFPYYGAAADNYRIVEFWYNNVDSDNRDEHGNCEPFWEPWDILTRSVSKAQVLERLIELADEYNLPYVEFVD